ncbi:PH domain-containing protein [Sodalis sp. RH16]|uniref:PH domain-containing protein n=1 Tax=Sodalis sp. RH16 TaxID=3394331 RepID=UPI0039B5D030
MASYVDSNLSKGEEVISRAHVSWLSYLLSIVSTIILLLFGLLMLLASSSDKTGNSNGAGTAGWVFVILSLAILGNIALTIFTTELALTNKRVIAKFGFIRRTTIELRLEKVESIGVNQGILGRMLGYGNIVIKGTGGTGTPIPSISKPLDFRRVVNNYIEENEKLHYSVS